MADRSCAELLGLLIDEVRSYAASVERSTDTLSAWTDQPEHSSHLDQLRLAAESLHRALDGAVELSSISQGEIELADVVFSPAQVLQDAIADLGTTAHAGGTDFRLRVDTEVPHKVSGDPDRLRTVLKEVISLATSTANGGPVHVELSANPDGRTRFRVHNTANQLSPRSSLLDPLAPWSRRPDGQIGLAVARHLIELMDGSLGYETNEERTAFWFDAALTPARRREDRKPRPSTDPPERRSPPTTPDSAEPMPGPAPEPALPTELPPEPTPPASAPRSVESTPPSDLLESDDSGKGRKLHVLVVDDSDVNRLLATSQLDRLGHSHETARSGLAALDLMSTGHFDAVLMDWHMPGMDGLEATRRWRDQHDPDGRLPVITMTASAMAGDRERCLDAGASDYLSKPVSIGDLGNMLTRWCAGGADATPPDAEADSPLSKIDDLIADLGDASVVHSIVEAFLDMVPQYRAAATTALATGDRPSIRRHAHTLKSTAIMLGTEDLATACSVLESAAMDDGADLEAAVADFSRCCRDAELTLIDLSALLVSDEYRTT